MGNTYTPYEQSLLDEWRALSVFTKDCVQDLPFDQFVQRECEQAPRVDAVFGKSSDASGWLVGPIVAAILARKVWTNAMYCKEYDRALSSIQKLREHAGPFDEHESTEDKILVCVARLGAGEWSYPAKELDDLIESGPRPPKTMSLWIADMFRRWVFSVNPEAQPTPELISLARTIVRTRHGSEALETQCEEMVNFRDFIEVIWTANGWESELKKD